MNRNSIIQHIEQWKSKLGSYAAVARRAGVSEASISTIMRGKYGANEAQMLQKIANELGYRESNWNLVESIGNYRRLASVFNDAKAESMWFAVSNKAGSCKSRTLEDLFNKDRTGTVVFIQAEEWSARQFLIKMVSKTIGAQALEKGYKTIAELTDIICGYFNDMSFEKPLLIIDEGDKLRPAALRTLIPLFNRTEERLGLILSGTENLKKEIKNGVRLNKKGFDELESRFGRTYITLRGASEKEVYEICGANGILDPIKQGQIWSELKKEDKPTQVKTAKGTKEVMIPYAEDFRLMKRLIKREVLR